MQTQLDMDTQAVSRASRSSWAPKSSTSIWEAKARIGSAQLRLKTTTAGYEG